MLTFLTFINLTVKVVMTLFLSSHDFHLLMKGYLMMIPWIIFHLLMTLPEFELTSLISFLFFFFFYCLSYPINSHSFHIIFISNLLLQVNLHISSHGLQLLFYPHTLNMTIYSISKLQPHSMKKQPNVSQKLQ